MLFVVLLLAIEVGYRIGRRLERRFSDSARGHINAIQASMLGILALILGFSFSRSVERLNTRSEAVVDEANAIGTAYLRAETAPPSVREPAKKLLRDYVDLRVEAAGRSFEDLDLSLIQAAEQHQTELWKLAQQAVDEDSGPVTALFVSSINDLIDSYGSRKAAIARHLPALALVLMHSMFVLTAFVVGFACGAEGHRPSAMCYFLVLLIVLLLFVVIDLDRPRRGMIEVPQRSLIDLQATLQAEENN
jgi:hypothetical protein